jgi:hypothetical protein
VVTDAEAFAELVDAALAHPGRPSCRRVDVQVGDLGQPGALDALTEAFVGLTKETTT